MLHASSSSTHFCLLLLCIITCNCITSVSSLHRDILATTCKQCADRTVNYDFCLTSIGSVPISHFTDLQGLAVIAMELALENATSSILTIQKMMGSGKFNLSAEECLKDCFQLYVDSVTVLMDFAEAFFYKQYDVVESLMLEIMNVTDMCEEGFKEKGEVSPLTKQNYNLFQLSDIDLCIINFLSVGLPYK